jgi:hypothetical protein
MQFFSLILASFHGPSVIINVCITGRKWEAFFYYNKALRIPPTHTESLLGAAKVLRANGQYTRIHQLMSRLESYVFIVVLAVRPFFFLGQITSPPWYLHGNSGIALLLYCRCTRFCVTVISHLKGILCIKVKR